MTPEQIASILLANLHDRTTRLVLADALEDISRDAHACLLREWDRLTLDNLRDDKLILTTDAEIRDNGEIVYYVTLPEHPSSDTDSWILLEKWVYLLRIITNLRVDWCCAGATRYRVFYDNGVEILAICQSREEKLLLRNSILASFPCIFDATYTGVFQGSLRTRKEVIEFRKKFNYCCSDRVVRWDTENPSCAGLCRCLSNTIDRIRDDL